MYYGLNIYCVMYAHCMYLAFNYPATRHLALVVAFIYHLRMYPSPTNILAISSYLLLVLTLYIFWSLYIVP